MTYYQLCSIYQADQVSDPNLRKWLLGLKFPLLFALLASPKIIQKPFIRFILGV